jgi:hypothetical protein
MPRHDHGIRSPSLDLLLTSAVAAFGIAALSGLPSEPASAQNHWSGNGPMLLGSGTACQSISNLTVSLHVTQNMLATTSGGDLKQDVPNGGFSFQLNASPMQKPTQPPVFWLQYLIIVQHNKAIPFVQYFDNAGTYSIYHPIILRPNALPAGNMIPAGYVLTVGLVSDPRNGNVTGANFSITDNAGKQTTIAMPSAAIPMPNYGRARSNNPRDTILSPFSTFALAIVGPPSYEKSTFLSGAGYITYDVPRGQLNQTQASTCGVISTGEQSNVSYGMISPSAGSSLVQPLTTPFSGALASTMDRTNNVLQVYHFTQYPANGRNRNNGNFFLNQFAYNGSWNAQNMNNVAGAPPATLGSAVLAYQDVISHESQIYYLASSPSGDQVIEQLSGTNWTPKSLTSVATAQPPALGSGLAGYSTVLPESNNIFYQGADRHVHLIARTTGRGWAEEKGLGVGPAAALASPLSGHATTQTDEVFYLGTDQHIYELWRWSTKFDGWHSQDVTQAVPAGVVAAVGSPLASFFDARTNTDALFFVGTDQHVHEFRYANHAWEGIDLTAASRAAPVGVGSMLAAHVNQISGSQEVFFVNGDQTIEEIWSPANGLSAWKTANLTRLAGGNTEAASLGGPLTAAVNTVSNTDDLYYIGSDGNVYGLSSPDNRRWSFFTP